MAEQLGGSRGRNDNMGGSKALVMTQRGGPAPAPGGGLMGTQRPSPGGGILGAMGGSKGGVRPLTARQGGRPAVPSGMLGGAGVRPLSAPRERPSPNYTKAGYQPGGGSPADARARVEELRQVKEAGYWGRDVAAKRDLPPYWSVSAFGQPFNDERLFTGATNHYQILEPAGLKGEDARVVGPATEQQASLRKSLTDGRRYFNRTDLSPLQAGTKPDRLDEPDRVLVLSKLTPFQRVHALRNCLDRDVRADDFKPWTEMVWERLDSKFWRRNKEMAIRLAVQKLENLMRRHLLFLSEQRCAAARAPAARTKDVLREAFWKVDPSRSGTLSLQQFLQVWQNVLCLLEYTDEVVALPNGRTRVVLKPGKRVLMDLNMCAGIFVKYGFDKDGLMPYVVFSNTLCAAPARLLGQELVLDKKEEGRHGLSSEVDVAYCVGDAKIIYPKCDMGVFPPSGFDPRAADRSRLPPFAHMRLEHVYGYAGMECLASNVFYTHNTKPGCTEMVYYTGAVGVVMVKELWDAGKPCQRHFFGHDNDITCIAIHPNRRFVATGQQKNTGPNAVPFIAIWDVDNCNLLQRLDHAEEERSVIAATFSGNPSTLDASKQGGELLITVTSDDKHTIHIWRWMTRANAFCKAVHVPGWFYGPHKKLDMIRSTGGVYMNPEDKDEEGNIKPWLAKPTEEECGMIFQRLKDMNPRPPLIDRIINHSNAIIPAYEEGFCDELPMRMREDGTWAKLYECPGCNGTPPMVYGIAWNPLRPSDGRRGSEFASYGVKHLKSWVVNDQETWQGTSGSFGTDHIENVLSACFVPAMHYMAAPGDSCILTGFSSGQVGLWVPPYPTRAGSVYQLVQKFNAHGPGKIGTLNDGTQQYLGVRVIKLRADPTGRSPVGKELLTAGSDGCVMVWELEEVTGTRKDGTPLRGVNLRCKLDNPNETTGPHRFLLQGVVAPSESPDPPSITALDCHPTLANEFIAGTDGCDIWEVDKDPRILIEGHEEDVCHVAVHPRDPAIFATACASGKVRLWHAAKRDVIRVAHIGFAVSGAAFSNEEYAPKLAGAPPGLHLALGSVGGYSLGSRHKVAVLHADTLQPLQILTEPTAQVDELKYSPAGGPGMLVAGAYDLTIYVWNASKQYQFVAKCCGHSGNIEHIDWSLPISQPGSKLHGQMIIQATDTSANLLYWDPRTGKKIPYNQRDAPWSTWTSRLGFPVMGIWPDYSDRTDINAVCRSRRGAPRFEPPPSTTPLGPSDLAASVMAATEEESADGVPGCGYLMTGDDFSTIRMFNYPVVWDDAPYKAFRGHSSHVMCVRFSCDDRYVMSVGGHDRGVFQWKTVGVAAEDQPRDDPIIWAVRAAIKHRGNEDAALEPKPGVEWVALDESGKTFGPKAVADLNATGGGGPQSGVSVAAGRSAGSVPGTPQRLSGPGAGGSPAPSMPATPGSFIKTRPM